MPDDKEAMNLLLIADDSATAAMLRQVMEQSGLTGEIRRMHQGRSAVAYARRSGPYTDAKSPDLILLDFSAPDERSRAIATEIAFGAGRALAPVILLTSPDSEYLLQSDVFQRDSFRMFAPTSLFSFIKKMRQHSRNRFLRALTVMYDLGPILVRLPASFVRRPDQQPALIA